MLLKQTCRSRLSRTPDSIFCSLLKAAVNLSCVFMTLTFMQSAQVGGQCLHKTTHVIVL